MDPTARFLEHVVAGELDEVRSALQKDPKLASARDAGGVSAVCLAMYRGHAKVAQELASKRKDLDLFEACAIGNTERVAELLTARVPVDEHAPDGFGALGLACFFSRPEIVDMLVAAGADPNIASKNDMRVCPLHSAAATSDQALAARMAKALLAAGANPNSAQTHGYVPLHEAALNGNDTLVDVLLTHGADVSLRNDDGMTAADLARSKDHPGTAARLQA